MSKIKVNDFMITPPVNVNPVPFFYLPAIPKEFKIVIDTREQNPYKFGKIPTIVKKLDSGDYSIEGLEHLVIIERKSQLDFYGSIGNGRDRFVRMWDRLLEHQFLGLIIECNEFELLLPEVTYSEIEKNSVYATIISFEIKRGIHVYYGNRRMCALKIANWLLVFHKNYTEKMRKNK